MVSLETLTPFPEKPIELESFQLVPRWSGVSQMFNDHFEWIFGLEHHTFPFNCELNMVSASKDIRQYLDNRSLIFVPTTQVLEKAYDMLIYNKDPSREPSERRRFEDFGTGPWEYRILPGRWNSKTKKSESLPPLFHCSPDKPTIPLLFDDYDYDTLPRFTSAVHPLIVILSLQLHVPISGPASQSIDEKVIRPLKKISRSWPQWQHTRFVPLPNARFKRSMDNLKAQNIDCNCLIFCSPKRHRPYYARNASASTPELEDSCTEVSEEEEEEDKELSRGEYKELCRTVDERISTWRGHLEGVSFVPVDVKRDKISDRYAQELTDDAEKVMLRQQEEQRKREMLAADLLDVPSKKRSRRT